MPFVHIYSMTQNNSRPSTLAAPYATNIAQRRFGTPTHTSNNLNALTLTLIRSLLSQGRSHTRKISIFWHLSKVTDFKSR